MRFFLVIFIFFTFCSTFGQTSLTKGEWFEGIDPGVGRANTFSISSSASISESVSLAVGHLSAGFHTLYVRVANNRGAWSHFEKLNFYILPAPSLSAAVPLEKGEWFIGSDPGIGHGNSFVIPTGISFNGVIDLTAIGIPTGFNQLYVRVCDANQRWSHYAQGSFYVLPAVAASSNRPKVKGGEWFIGSDPGVGNGTSFQVSSASSTYSGIIDLSTAGLTTGFKQLFLRVKDSLNRWSHYESASFYVLPPVSANASTPRIQSGEWFIGSDPGVGNGTSFSITPSSNFSGIIDLSTTGLTTGFHQLFLRVKDSLNRWSHYESASFYVLPPVSANASTPRIQSGEWFIGSDPGVGNGTSFSITPSSNFLGIIDLSTTGLTTGFHQLFLRVKDSLNRWSHYESTSFYVLPPSSSTVTSELVAGEWFIGNDPGIGNATGFTIPQSSQFSGILPIDLTGVSEGFHQLYVRVKDTEAKWSHYEMVTFYVLPVVNPTVTTNLLVGEYYLNTDPGVGLGTPFSIPNTPTINLPIALDISTLPDGDHTIYFRVKDELGKWSHYESKSFFICGDLIDQPTYVGNLVFCQGQQIQVSGIPVNGISSAFWTGPNGYRLESLSLLRNNATPAMSGAYRFHVVSALGRNCDTNYVEVNVVVNPTYSNYQQLTLCYGDTLRVGTQVYTSAGFYTTILQRVTGCDSVISTSLSYYPQNMRTQTVQLCSGESYSIGSHTYSTNGTYTDTLVGSNGCDSIVVTQLSIGDPLLSTQLDFANGVLHSNQSDVYYQWYDCSIQAPITGAIQQDFVVPQNGSYSVLLQSTRCPSVQVMSDCFEVTNLATSNQQVAIPIRIFPNPTNEKLWVELPTSWIGSEFELMDLQGKLLSRMKLNSSLNQLDLSEFAAGTYLVKISTDHFQNLYKITKE